MDYVQALFSFFISPLLGVVLMGMFWKRATKAGGFWGLLLGTLTSIGTLGLGLLQSCGTALCGPLARRQGHGREYVSRLVVGHRLHLVTFIVSLLAKRPVAELDGLVYGATILPVEEPVPFYKISGSGP